MVKDLRSFIDELSKVAPNEILRVKKMVNPAEMEVTAILNHLRNRGKYPAVFFERVSNVNEKESKLKLITNVFANRERCAVALGVPPTKCKMELSLEYYKRENEKKEPVQVPAGEAPVKEVIMTGNDVDLMDLPIVKHNEMDPAPYIDMVNIVKDPDEGFYNSAFVRNQLKGPRKLGVFMSRRHNWLIFRKYEERGEPTPVAIVAGHHPAFYIGSLTLAPFGVNEYEICGGMMKEPVRLVESQTWGEDFLVPADAEIVIEGEMPPNVRDPEAPFGEYTGYYGPEVYSTNPVINVTAITCRENAIYQDISAGSPDHQILGSIPKEGGIYNVVKARVPTVTAVHLPISGCCRYICYISIKKVNEGDPKMAALAALGRDEMIKYVVVVDDDVDVFDERRVLWAIATRTQPFEDIDVIRDVKSDTHDPSLVKPDLGSKAIINATKPITRPFMEEISVPKSLLERIKLENYIEKGE